MYLVLQLTILAGVLALAAPNVLARVELVRLAEPATCPALNTPEAGQ